jgi:hypothetical protein
MFVGTNEPTKEVVNKELLCLKGFKVGVKDIKCLLEWWAKHESLFPNVVFLFIKFVALLVLKYKIERKFSLFGIITNLKGCHLESNNLDKIIFVSKNWPSDHRVDYSSISLIELIEVDIALEEILEQYEGEFE